jgi:hypothetical protein
MMDKGATMTKQGMIPNGDSIWNPCFEYCRRKGSLLADSIIIVSIWNKVNRTKKRKKIEKYSNNLIIVFSLSVKGKL